MPVLLFGVITHQRAEVVPQFRPIPKRDAAGIRPSIICPHSTLLRIPKYSSDAKPSNCKAPTTAPGSLTRMESSFASRLACSAPATVAAAAIARGAHIRTWDVYSSTFSRSFTRRAVLRSHIWSPRICRTRRGRILQKGYFSMLGPILLGLCGNYGHHKRFRNGRATPQ
jgi:hypothetical protein